MGTTPAGYQHGTVHPRLDRNLVAVRAIVVVVTAEAAAATAATTATAAITAAPPHATTELLPWWRTLRDGVQAR